MISQFLEKCLLKLTFRSFCSLNRMQNITMMSKRCKTPLIKKLYNSSPYYAKTFYVERANNL